MRSYQQYLDFIIAYHQHGDFDEERLLASYLGDGEKAARDLINNFYNQFEDQDFYLQQSYIDHRKQQYDDALRIFALYDGLGCISNNQIDESKCARTPSPDVMAQFESLSESMRQAAVMADKNLQDTITYLKSRCWDLSAWLKDPVDERDQEEP